MMGSVSLYDDGYRSRYELLPSDKLTDKAGIAAWIKGGALSLWRQAGDPNGNDREQTILLLQDKPVFIHTLEVFAALDEIREIILVTGAADVERSLNWVKEYQLDSRVCVIPGGKERQHSVHEGLKALGTDGVLVHDGVRPL